jgi:hypothetical protein
MPHAELPCFNGDNPRAWILESEDIFRLVGIHGEARVKWRVAHIRGQAKIWLNSSGINIQQTSWADLCQVLIERFPDTVTLDPMEQLQQLKQRTTVDSYINTYESWMQVMKRGRDYLPTNFFVDRFISGLNENIRHLVQCQCPVSLLKAYWFARQFEKNHNSNALVLRRALPVAPVQLGPARNAAGRDNQNRVGPPRDNINHNSRPRVP